MSLTLALVGLSALLHSGWNALIKSVTDKVATSGYIALVSGIVGVAMLVLNGPPPLAVWPFAVASGILQTVYLAFLVRAYHEGELSRVYPVARGTSPIVVTLVAVLALGERPTGWAWAGLIILIGGIVGLTLARGWPKPGSGLGLALLTGLTIAGYTLVDGVGVRQVSESASYIGAIFTVYGVLGVTYTLFQAGPERWQRARRTLVPGVIGGGLSVLAYGIVVWAQSRAPLAMVSALRETSVVWALVIGRLWFGDQLSRREQLAVGLAIVGAVIMQVAAAG